MANDIYDAAWLSDVGRVRHHNEDAALARSDLGLWLVADGMGGHAAGDFAAATVVEAAASVGLASSLDDLQARLLGRLAQAHHDVAMRGLEIGSTVGTTVVALMAYGDRWACAWAGDSRLYRMRDGTLDRLSRDHTEVEGLLADGTISEAEARSWPRRNVITRALGVTDGPLCDSVEGDLAVGDVFMLCSDGLTEHLEDAEIAAALASGQPSDAICRDLVDAVLARGATDNVTCVTIRVRGPFAQP